MKIFQMSDVHHIAIAGRLAEYMVRNDIWKVHTNLVDEVCYTQRLPINTKDRRNLEEIEGETVRSYIEQGHTMYNTAKRVERIRTNSAASRSDMSRSISARRL